MKRKKTSEFGSLFLILPYKSNLFIMKKATLFIFLFCSVQLFAQQLKYITDKNFTVQGKAFNNAPFYHRIDTNKYAKLPTKVKELLTAPAGLYVAFKSNTSQIKLDWTTRSTYNWNHGAWPGFVYQRKRKMDFCGCSFTKSAKYQK